MSKKQNTVLFHFPVSIPITVTSNKVDTEIDIMLKAKEELMRTFVRYFDYEVYNGIPLGVEEARIGLPVLTKQNEKGIIIAIRDYDGFLKVKVVLIDRGTIYEGHREEFFMVSEGTSIDDFLALNAQKNWGSGKTCYLIRGTKIYPVVLVKGLTNTAVEIGFKKQQETFTFGLEAFAEMFNTRKEAESYLQKKIEKLEMVH